jgi:hypothetical protein
VSIVPFDHQKWPCLFLGPCSFKSAEINMTISTSYARYALLKSAFYLLPTANNTKNKLNFPHFSSIFKMVSPASFFFSPFFSSFRQRIKGCFIGILEAVYMFFLMIISFSSHLSFRGGSRKFSEGVRKGGGAVQCRNRF